MEQLWTYLMGTVSDTYPIDEDALLLSGLEKIQQLHHKANSDESGALEVWSSHAATHDILTIAVTLGLLVIMMARLLNDMTHQFRADLRSVEEKYVEYYRDLSKQVSVLAYKKQK